MVMGGITGIDLIIIIISLAIVDHPKVAMALVVEVITTIIQEIQIYQLMQSQLINLKHLLT
jgi:hypothetical protein